MTRLLIGAGIAEDEDRCEPVGHPRECGIVGVGAAICRPKKAPLCKGGWQKSLIFDWGIVGVGALQSLRLPFGQPPPFAQGRLMPLRLTYFQ